MRRMSMADIARAADLDHRATQRLVYTLEKLGYLRRFPESLLCGLTSKVLQRTPLTAISRTPRPIPAS